jgi:hypothetical protein
MLHLFPEDENIFFGRNLTLFEAFKSLNLPETTSSNIELSFKEEIGRIPIITARKASQTLPKNCWRVDYVFEPLK